MKDNLRRKGYLPLKEPYTDLVAFAGQDPCFIHVGKGGGETTTANVLSREGADAIVDWVFLELHDSEDPAKVVATRSALLQRDGDIVDIDGVSPVEFDVINGAYFIAIRHRNHLGTMTGVPIKFSENLVSFDFTDVDQLLYRLADPRKTSDHPTKNVNGVNCLWGGNSNGDRKVIFQGPGLDQDKLFFDIQTDSTNINITDGHPNLNYIINDYCIGDNNMDGELKYQGPDNDIDVLQFFNVILHEENSRFLSNKIIYEQIPRE